LDIYRTGGDPMSSATRINRHTRGLRAAVPQFVAIALLIAGAVTIWHSSAVLAKAAVVIPPPASDQPGHGDVETIVLAGGCFWGVQGVFQHVKGVTSALSGYSGGASETARYEVVGTGRTGHAEAVKITFDPQQISYGQILQIFFSVVHDPTELNRQGPDVGPQYRSAIFPANSGQSRVAENYIDQLNKAGVFSKPIATRDRTVQRVLSGGGLSSGFSHAEARLPLHRHQ
jgi:peptide-methionine (S)-S-oxide reductase